MNKIHVNNYLYIVIFSPIFFLFSSFTDASTSSFFQTITQQIEKEIRSNMANMTSSATAMMEPGCTRVTQLTTNGTTVQDSGTGGLCLGCSVVNEANLLDNDLTNFSTIVVTTGIGNRGFVELKLGQTYPAGTRGGFIADLSGSGIGLFNGVSLTSSLGGIVQQVINGGDLLNLLGFGGNADVSTVFCAPFDELRFEATSLVGATATYKVYFGYVDEGCTFTVQCGAAPSPEICDDNIDNDGDGFIDDEDSECATGPGGVIPNLTLWLKADEGVVSNATDVLFWKDYAVTNNDIDVNQVNSDGLLTGGGPTYNTTASINYNPTVDFDGTEGLSKPAELLTEDTDYTIFAVREKTSGIGALLSQSDGDDGINPQLLADGQSINTVSIGGSTTTANLATNNNEPTLFAAYRENIIFNNYSMGARLNGNAPVTSTVSGFLIDSNDQFQVGFRRIDDGTVSITETYNGKLAELIVYDTYLSSTDIDIVESYLAVKYGITLAHNYLASDGTTIYDITTYANDIAGIGRDDDKNGLYQKQAKSENNDAIVAMGLNALATTNADNVEVFANNRDFMLWGNDDAAATWSLGDVPDGYERILRTWQVTETGTVGAVEVQIDMANTNFDIPDLEAGTSYYLLRDTNGDNILADETPIAMTETAPGSNIWSASGIDFVNGESFSIATEADSDNDGVADSDDLDDDNDGIPDTIECNSVDTTPAACTLDTDGDGIPDRRDLDSDNDGIPDAVEWQLTADYQVVSTSVNPDGTPVTPAQAVNPADTDGDGTPDYLSGDSDNDGTSDTVEAGLTLNTFDDIDFDGLDDDIDIDDANFGTASAGITAPLTDYPSTVEVGEVDWRVCAPAPTSDGEETSCNGDAPKTLSVTTTAGTTVDWYAAATGGTALITNTTTYTPTTFGSYYAEARNTTTGCISKTRTEVTAIEAPLLEMTTSTTPVSIAGGTDGTATASPTGGTAPYTYVWNTLPAQTTATATNLMAGTYTVTVTDANNCTVIETAEVTETTITLSVTATSNALEPGTSGFFTIAISDAFITDVVVNYTVSGTATAATDYQALTGVVTIPAGSLSVPIEVVVIDDVIQEPAETVIIILTSVTPPQIQMPTAPNDAASITIEDNEKGTLSIDDVSLLEGADGSSTNMTFTVTLTGTLAADASVDYATSDFTALAGLDYTASTGTITFPAGSVDGATQTFNVPILGDPLVEPSETFNVTLSNLTTTLPTGEIQIADNQGEGTILDGTVISVNIDDVVVTEGSAVGTTAATFTVSLVGGTSTTDVIVTYNTTNGTAEDENGTGDYQSAIGQTVTIPAGATAATFDILINQDLEVEMDENFTVTIAAVGATVGDNTGTATITNDDFAPVITNNGSAATHAYTYTENATSDIDDFEATDGNGETENGGGLTWSLSGGLDIASFTIDAATGVLTFTTSPDFESPTDNNMDNIYEVVVTISDAASHTDIQNLTITVQDENEAPVITSDGGGATAALTVVENQTAVTIVTATDPDAGDVLSYTISGGVDQGVFTLDATTGELIFMTSPDFENPTDANTDNIYEVEVTVSDASGLTDVQTLTITVQNANEAPVITSNGGGDTAVLTVAENQTAVTTVTATDPDAGDVLSYTISGGADQGIFTIDATTGELVFTTNPNVGNPVDSDMNNVYEVEVTVSDIAGLMDVQTLMITVQNANEAPEITSNGGGNTANISVTENQTIVTTVVANDPDAGDMLSYSISGGIDQNLFMIDPTTGELSFIISPDFENPTDANMDNNYEIIVTATDIAGLTDDQALTVTVTNENEAPVFINYGGAATATTTLNENTIVVEDFDTADDTDSETNGITYSITGLDAGLLAIDAVTGILSFNSAPNFENPMQAGATENEYLVDITTTDSEGAMSLLTLTIIITDLCEATGPTISQQNYSFFD